MAFKVKKTLSYAVIRRGQREQEILYFGDKPQYTTANGIYADVAESDITGLATLLDGKVQSYRLRGADIQRDENFVPVPDSKVNDAVGKLLTINFSNGKTASMYVPMILSTKVDDVVTKVGGFKWKDSDDTALVVSRIDYKTSKDFAATTSK